VIRYLGGGYELDDDRDRIDITAVHAFLSEHAYWALGRPRERQERLVRDSSRVLGLYRDGAQVGFARAVSDGNSIAYLADVYVLPEHRRRGLGLELVREMVERGPFAHVRWVLHTEDGHGLYARVGFGPPGPKVMERPARPEG
jgi:ribosomal protein S18 acetylase RimI-like enzyme